MGKRWSEADLNRALTRQMKLSGPPPADEHPASTISTSPESARVVTASNRRTSDKRYEDQKPAALKPRFSLAHHEGYEGKLFKAYGLTNAQAEHLCRAALSVGISEQQ